jgi:predicted transposase YbfD/YdcC
MDSSTPTLPSSVAPSTPAVFSVHSLLHHLQQLTDSRHRRGRRYPLHLVVLLIVLAKLSDQDHLSAIADWAHNHQVQLLPALDLNWPRMPHHNTFRRLIEEVVDPAELEKLLSQFFQSLGQTSRSILISMDGKTLRGTIDEDDPRGEHLLAAYLPEEGVVLMQVSAGQKENEITVAPKLLGCLDLRGKVVAADAMHTQRGLSVQILEAGGDYLWLVKDNQPHLREDIEELFEGDRQTVLGGQVPNDFRQAHSLDKGHGRVERREISVSSELRGYSDWPGLEQVFRLERQRVECKSGKQEREVVWGLTSLREEEASAERLLYLCRAYWGIENGLHHRRDVTFEEDRCRLTRGHAGRVVAAINNLVIGLLRHVGYSNLAQARRKYEADFRPAISLLTASPLRL